MIAKKYVSLIALGACLVGLSVLGSTKNPVTRPFKDVLHQTLVITLDGNGKPESWALVGTGNFSHLGLVENRGEGTYNADGSPRGTGFFTAANGDQLFWSSPDGVTSFFTGGTGRFVSATGISTGGGMEIVFRPDPPPGTLVGDMVLWAEGTITY